MTKALYIAKRFTWLLADTALFWWHRMRGALPALSCCGRMVNWTTWRAIRQTDRREGIIVYDSLEDLFDDIDAEAARQGAETHGTISLDEARQRLNV